MYWWFCLKHLRVEQGPGCPDEARLGPYDSAQVAAQALTRMRENTQAQDACDEE